jgi:hypothetical protein
MYPGVHSFSYMNRSGITGSYGRSTFSFLRALHTAFHSCCTNSHPHQQWEVFLFPHILTSLFVILVIVILIGVRWNLSVVLICISFVAKDAELFLICLLAIYTSSFENCLLPIYLVGCWFFEKLVFLSSLYILVINLLSVI